MKNRLMIAAALLGASVTLAACDQPENASDNTTTGSVGTVIEENSIDANPVPKDETKPADSAAD